jgi:hypothetical protein
MHADLDTLLTTVYCMADDLLPCKPDNARRRVTDAEVVTLCVARRSWASPRIPRFLARADNELRHLPAAAPAARILEAPPAPRRDDRAPRRDLRRRVPRRPRRPRPHRLDASGVRALGRYHTALGTRPLVRERVLPKPFPPLLGHAPARRLRRRRHAPRLGARAGQRRRARDRRGTAPDDACPAARPSSATRAMRAASSSRRSPTWARPCFDPGAVMSPAAVLTSPRSASGSSQSFGPARTSSPSSATARGRSTACGPGSPRGCWRWRLASTSTGGWGDRRALWSRSLPEARSSPRSSHACRIWPRRYVRRRRQSSARYSRHSTCRSPTTRSSGASN